MGAYGQLTQNPNVPIPGTEYKRSKNVFPVIFIALSCGRVWARLLHPLAQSLIGSPGTLHVESPVDKLTLWPWNFKRMEKFKRVDSREREKIIQRADLLGLTNNL